MKHIEQWQCDTCNALDDEQPWECPGCGKELCENCFWQFMHCRTCAEKTSEDDMKSAADEMYGTEFSKPDPTP